jgi:glycosyltransferase involved in cell wall biosynthesis
MKILIHALGATMGGGRRHLTSFLPELGKQDRDNEYVVLVRQSFPPLEWTEGICIERVPDQIASGIVARSFHDVIQLPRRVSRERFDLVVSLTNFGPVWARARHMLFQRNPIYYCDAYLSRVYGWAKIDAVMRRRLAIESMKRADMIVTPSGAMAKMIQQSCAEVAGREFRTLYHGFNRGTMEAPLNMEYRRHLDTEGYKLLYPTHAAVHKGFEMLFEILSRLKQKGIKFKLLATISRDDWPQGVERYERQIADLGLRDHVVFTGNVPQQQIGELYRSCDAMVYPSLCESFGFSMIEAMGYGLPIVAVGTEVNREMCGDAAVYYPAGDADAGASAICHALEDATGHRLKEAARARLSDFDWGWSRYAREFIQLVGRMG